MSMAEPAPGPLASVFQPTILLAMALMAIIVMMILPMPAWVLDIGLAASFGLAILIFTVTLFIERPLDFSAFPTVLLASLMLRLSLNISSTKLIVGQGHKGTAAAGNVIEGFAMFVMGGSVLIGLVVFGVLMIVNFIVITKGAARMAEVGARFALDGMPGKQLAIDSDMSAGAIDHKEAKERRQLEQAETTFFGSLDGASKFVKGDAVAGLLITLLNLVMGLGIGIGLHGMPFSRALETYAILTVGDGLVSQIPAVIISIASALLLSRGGTRGAADKAFFDQLSRHPNALAAVALLMLLFALMPGLPFLPFLIGAAALAAIALAVRRRDSRAVARQDAEPSPPAPEASIGDRMELDEIHVEFAPDLVAMAMDPATGLEARIDNMRAHIASTFGLIIPEIRLTDNPALPAASYAIRIQGVEQARDRLEPDRVLMLLGDGSDAPVDGQVKEPVFGAPARWIEPSEQEEAALRGLTVVSPAEVLATHLLEVIKRNFGRLLGYRSLRRIIDAFTGLSDPARAEANRRMIDEMIPEKVPFELLQSVLRLLLEEQVSIRNLPLILESIAEARARSSVVEEICEFTRHRLGFQIVSELRREDGTLPLVQLAPEWEELFLQHAVDGDGALPEIALPPEALNRLAGSIAEKLDRAGGEGIYPAVATSTRRRRFLRMVLSARGIGNPVFSFDEIGTNARPSLVGVA